MVSLCIGKCEYKDVIIKICHYAKNRNIQLL